MTNFFQELPLSYDAKPALVSRLESLGLNLVSEAKKLVGQLQSLGLP